MLTRALTANAFFSGLSALLFFAFADPVAAEIGLRSTDVLVLGGQLAVFAVFLTWLVRLDPGRRRVRAAVVLVIALDALWVLGSAAFTVAVPGITVSGVIGICAVSVVVGALAACQALGLKRLLDAPPDPGLQTHT